MAKRFRSSQDSRLQVLLRVKMGWRGRSANAAELMICLTLLDAGYLDGWMILSAKGRPTRVEDLQLTRAGRELLDQLQPFGEKPRRILERQTSILLKGLFCYVLMVLFFFLLRLNDDAAAASQKEEVSQPPRMEKIQPKTSLRDWPVGVCGLPPVE